MAPIDWILTCGAVALVLGIAFYTKHYVKSVTDFVAGGRVAGRYIICNAQGEAASGVSNTVSKFQTLLTMGFAMQWWDTTPVLILVALSGWVIYRYRQTRAMTIGQFFEIRYSRSFRLFAGVLGFISGLLNYGIFPAVSAAFFVYFMGLPEHVKMGMFNVPTASIIMAVYLAGSLWMMIVGGQVTLLIVDCIEGILSHAIYVVVVISIFCVMGWGEIRKALVGVDTPPANVAVVQPADKSAEPGKSDVVVASTMKAADEQSSDSSAPSSASSSTATTAPESSAKVANSTVKSAKSDAKSTSKATTKAATKAKDASKAKPKGDAKAKPKDEKPWVGHSMLNPFNQSKTKDFNFSYQMMLLLTSIYGYMTVQKDNTFTSAARTPHESRMGRVLGSWRTYARTVMLVVVSIAAYAYIKQPDFPGFAALHAIDGQTQDQMRVPIALRFMLPIGVKGLFCAMMILSLTAGDAAHILTWGGVFVQDIVVPFRGDKPLSQKHHVLALRLAISFVALFAFCFSQVFTQTQYVTMWWNVTEAIFAGGAGAAIIGGLYWKKGTTAGAWAGVITGSSIAILGIVVPWWSSTFPDSVAAVVAKTPHFVDYAIKNFPNGMQMKFSAELAAIVVYVVISLLTCKEDHNMDKLLHRGKYAVASDQELKVAKKPKSGIAKLLDFSDDFTFWDKIVAGGVFFWSMLLLGVVIGGSVWNLAWGQWSVGTWANFWFYAGICLPLGIGLFTLVWFTIGGTHDMLFFFRRLATMKRDMSDTGVVNRKREGEAGMGE